MYDVRAKMYEYERDFSTKEEIAGIQDKLFVRMDDLRQSMVTPQDFEALRLAMTDKAHISRIDEVN